MPATWLHKGHHHRNPCNERASWLIGPIEPGWTLTRGTCRTRGEVEWKEPPIAIHSYHKALERLGSSFWA